MNKPSSCTPEGQPDRCPSCGNEIGVEPATRLGDAPCPRCGSLAWFSAAARGNGVLVDEVLDLNVATKAEAIRSLVVRLSELGCISPDMSETLVAAIMAREELGSTGIGRGVAIPHVHHRSVERTVGIVGYAASGIDFNSLDGRLVKIVVLLLSPTDKPGDQLRALEWISRTLRAARL